MNAETTENKTEIAFKSIRFEKALAERLGDFVHAKKKKTKTSIDAEVQAAVAAWIDRDPLHALLDQIIESGHEPTIRRVREMLVAAEDAAKKGAAGQAKPKKFYRIGGEKKGDPERDE